MNNVATVTITYDILKEAVKETADSPKVEIDCMLNYGRLKDAGELATLLEDHFDGSLSINETIEMLRADFEEEDCIRYIVDNSRSCWFDVMSYLAENYTERCGDFNLQYEVLILNVIDVEDRILYVITYTADSRQFAIREHNF